MNTIERTTSLVNETSAQLKTLVSNAEKSHFLKPDEVRAKLAFLINPKQSLFANLNSFFNKQKCLDDLTRILKVCGGTETRYQITAIGLSHLIEYCLKYELPNDARLLKSFIFIIFSVFDKVDSRSQGNVMKFDEVYDYINSELAENVDLTACEIDGSKVIKISFLTTTYVCEQVNTKLIADQVLAKLGQYLISDQFGYFKAKIGVNGNEKYDAIAIMNVKQDESCHVDLFRNKYSIIPAYYKQLVAEVRALRKIKSTGHPNGVKFRGITKFGFVKPLTDMQRFKKTALNVALMDSNSKYFTTNAGKLYYSYDQCVLSYMDDIEISANRVCRELMDINALVAHKLLHNYGLGTKCKNAKCNIVGHISPTIQSALAKRYTGAFKDIVLDETLDDVDDGVDTNVVINEHTKDVSLSSDARMVKGDNNYMYMSAKDKSRATTSSDRLAKYKSVRNTEDDASSSTVVASNSDDVIKVDDIDIDNISIASSSNSVNAYKSKPFANKQGKSLF
nr:VP6 [Kadipiro virus]